MALRAGLVGAVLAGSAVVAGLMGCTTRHRGPPNDHFDGREFRNAELPPAGAFWKFVRWQLFEPGISWPEKVTSEHDRPPQRVYGDDLRVSYVGHATVLLQVAGVNILTDPVWAQRASPFAFAGPKRVREPGVSFDDLPPIDLVLVSHNHYDHLDAAMLAQLWRRDRPLIVAPLGNLGAMRSRAEDLQAVELDWGESIDKGPIRVTAEPMQHWSARGPIDQNLSLWAAFVLRTPAGAIYFAGDTGYGNGEHFRTVASKHGRLRLAILPIGGYDPRWFVGYAHMNPEETVEAGMDLHADHVLGHHWATFRLTNEAIDEPAERFRAAAAGAGISASCFRAITPGSSWNVPAERCIDAPEKTTPVAPLTGGVPGP
jgi:L-ascorbate metabolism protein UlaG (beta-lactamase superfamily)